MKSKRFIRRRFLALLVLSIAIPSLTSCALPYNERYGYINGALDVLDYRNAVDEVIYEFYDRSDGVFAASEITVHYGGFESFKILEDRIRNDSVSKCKETEVRESKDKSDTGEVLRTYIKSSIECRRESAKVEIYSSIEKGGSKGITSLNVSDSTNGNGPSENKK
jgi:hypothetical protein